MKKIITWILLAAMLLGMFAGCGKSEDPTQPSTAPVEIPNIEATEGENNAADVTNYLKGIYKDSGAKTAGNFQRFGIVRIAGVPYEVVWTADVSEDLVKIIVNDDGTVTIDVNERCPEDTIYTLTATVTDANGNTSTATWEYLLPGTASLEEMQATVDEAYALDVGAAMTEERVLSGVIKSIDTPWSDQYQNISVVMLVEGRESKPILCYRLKGEGAKDLVPGDTITVQGIIKNYKGTIEFDAGCQLVTVEKTGTPVEMPTDPHQIMEDVYALGRNEALPYGPVTLTGPIISIDEAYTEQYKNVTVTIRVDWYTIKCYRMTGAGVENLEMNDIITVQGYIKNYNGTREFDKPTLLNVVKVGAYPQPTDPVEVVQAAYNLDAGWTLPYSPVTLTGFIKEVKTAWSNQYKNITVTMVVEGAENMPIECYRMVSSGKAFDSVIKTLKKGDQITVKGMLMNYQNTKSGKTTVEFSTPELVGVVPAEYFIVNDAYELAPGESLGTQTLTGKIISVDTPYSSQHGNITVTIQVGNMADKPIQCYRMKGYGADKLKVGDEIVVTGELINYNGKVQFNAGCSFIPTKLPKDQEALVNIAYSLASGQALAEECSLTGQIITVDDPYSDQYKNITVTIQVGDMEDMPIMCYRMKGTGAENLGLGDVITVTGIIKNFKGTVEFDTGCTFKLVRDGDPSEVEKEVVVPATLAEQIAEAAALSNGKFLAYKSEITGVIQNDGKFATDVYKGVTEYDFNVSDGTNTIYCYGLKATDGSVLKVGDTVKVTGYLTAYNGNPQFSYASEYTLTLVSAGSGGSGDSGSTDTKTYGKITSIDQLTTGNYVMVVSTGFAPAQLSGNWVLSAQPTISGDTVTDAKGAVWAIEVTDGNAKLTDANGVTVKPSGSASNNITSGDFTWAIQNNGDGTFTFKAVDANGAVTNYFCSNPTSENKFRAYKSSTIDSYPDSYPKALTLYKEGVTSGGGTTPPVTPEEPVVTKGTIADALAASDGDLYEVKGVVTYVEYASGYTNFYIQDGTGGICGRLEGDSSDVAGRGDTIIVSGSKTSYNGLPQLQNATVTMSEGVTLNATAKSTLSTTDICTYVTMTDLHVQEVSDGGGKYTTPNITVKDSSGNTITLYKAVVGKTGDAWNVKVGDLLTVTAAVGYNNGFQLRNMETDDLVVTGYKAIEANDNVVKYTFADYAKGTQYADETHVLDSILTMHIVQCHLNTQLRIYGSDSHDGIATFTATKAIKSVVINAGNAAATLNVYASTDGVTYTLVSGLTTASAYADHTLTLPENTKYVKLDAVGAQVRVSYMTITFAE